MEAKNHAFEAAYKLGRVDSVQFDSEDLRHAQIEDAAFYNCRFSECRFDEARIGKSRFVNCRFVHCTFRQAEFLDCLFIDGEGQTGSAWEFCDLTEVRFVQCNLGMNKFFKSEAYLLAFEECAAVGMSFDANVHRQMSNQVITGGLTCLNCKMQYAVFAPASYEESRFEGCDLRDCDFSESDLSRVSFRASALNTTDFAGAVLDGAVLAGATFERLEIAVMASYRGLIVDRGQHEAILGPLGVLTVG